MKKIDRFKLIIITIILILIILFTILNIHFPHECIEQKDACYILTNPGVSIFIKDHYSEVSCNDKYDKKIKRPVNICRTLEDK